jgi:hypothetical protein
MYERALWKDEVVVSFNERAESPSGDEWVRAYGLGPIDHLLPISTPVPDTHTLFGRTVPILDERAEGR